MQSMQQGCILVSYEERLLFRVHIYTGDEEYTICIGGQTLPNNADNNVRGM